MELKILQKKYPKFVYEKFSYKISDKKLEIFFDFLVEPDLKFRPKIVIENIDKKRLAKIGDRALDNLAFHLGLIEIPSYWKATLAPEIEIKAGSLNKEQINWWKDLIINGMGQFFYENKIDWRRPDFLKITSLPRTFLGKHLNGSPKYIPQLNLKNRYLVPVGGGKDAIVTL
ncbi:hypothetical protein MUP06_01730, partial [Patescibacteria group bacterium]|nr:hypothetical protein [Patescibacteria group bacterium]